MYFFKILILLLITVNTQAQNKLVITMSKKSKVDKLTTKEISKIFLSKVKSFPNGEKAIPIEVDNKNLQIKFYKAIANKNQKQLQRYWAKVIFTGKGIPPKKFENIDKTLYYLKNNTNAISYIEKRFLDTDLKVIQEIN